MRDWREIADKVVERFCGNMSEKEKLRYLALGLAGEIGELVDEIKQEWRGRRDISAENLGSELADITIYVYCVARAAGINLEQELLRKSNHNAKRFLRGLK